MGRPTLTDLLGIVASPSDRVRGLLLLGLSPATVAATTRSSTSTIRNWTTGATRPRGDAEQIIDDLRAVALALVDADIEPAVAARWLTSRNPKRFDGMRPVELVPSDPLDVLAAAQEFVLGLT